MSGRRTVLIVEDDKDIAALETALLDGIADVRLLVDEFTRALRPETWHRVEVAVVDLMLRHIEGEDVCRYLRDEFPHIRRIICTAKSTLLIPELAELAHVVLQKPFRPEDFVAAVMDPDVPR